MSAPDLNDQIAFVRSTLETIDREPHSHSPIARHIVPHILVSLEYLRDLEANPKKLAGARYVRDVDQEGRPAMTYTQADANAMPEWPERETWPNGALGDMAFEAARAEAALARLRVAVDKLETLSEASWDADDVRCYALDALAAIGELPQ